MNMELAARYRQLRARGVTAAHALNLARYQQRTAAYPWLDKLDTHNPVHGTIGPFTVHVSVEDDADYRLGEDDVTGTFSDTYAPGAIRNTHRNWGTDYQWYHPSTVAQNRYNELHAGGASKQVAREQAAARLRQDMADDAGRAYYGVHVSVTCDGIHLAEESLWAIDTVPGYDGHAYLVQVAEDLIAEALPAARDAIPAEIERITGNLAALRHAAAPTVSLRKRVSLVKD